MAGGRVRSVPRGLAGATSVAIAAAALIMLTGCTGSDEQPTPTTSPTSSQTTSSAVPTAAPTLAPKGSAQENKAFFDYVNQRTINTAKNPTAEQFVAGLAAAGFDKADMQMTADRTTVNLTPGSVQFSVLINHGCLIGQFGQEIGGYHSMVASVLSTGKCLIGDTVPVH